MARNGFPQASQDDSPRVSGNLSLTQHALQRMDSRRISDQAVEAAMHYGRTVYVRGVIIYAIGKREVTRCLRWGVRLTAFEGVHVVCAQDGAVLTVYRNRNLRHLRS